jgi:flavin reductase (DIM6/NTAB) family NADH-FMN oxidoreductase RutF
MNIDLESLSSSQVYHLMTQSVIPRPIAWVLTESENKSYNLAPFSYFTAVSSQPPLLMISVGKKPTGEWKDTKLNAVSTEKLVIHIPSVGSEEQVTKTSATLAYGHSEVEENDIKLVDFEGFDLPRVEGCAIAFGCSLFQVQEIGDAPQSLIFAQIESIFIDDSMVSDSDNRLNIDALTINPLTRLGGSEFANLDQVITVSRPQ